MKHYNEYTFTETKAADEHTKTTVQTQEKTAQKTENEEETTRRTTRKKLERRKEKTKETTDEQKILEGKPENITFDEERVDKISVPEEMSTKVLPTQTTNIISEAVTTSQVTHTEKLDTSTKAKMLLIPQSALEEQEVIAAEREQDSDIAKYVPAKAIKTLDSVESYQTSEQVAQAIPGTFETTFQPVSNKASENIVTSESITVEEIHTGNIPESFNKEITLSSQANVSLLEQEASTVTEVQFDIKESIFAASEQPKTSKASTNFNVQNSVNVEEIIQADTENLLVSTKATTIKPKLDIDSHESVLVEEINTEIKPGKYLPEAFVPTEVASEKIIPQISLNQTELITDEVEGDFISQKLPTGQKADVEFSMEQGVIISETAIQDKESPLDKIMTLQEKASENITLLEGVSITSVESQQPQTDLELEKLVEKRAELVVSPIQTIITTTNTSIESEELYKPSDKLPEKTASVDIACLEISSVGVVDVQESEQELKPENKPTTAVASKKIKQMKTIEISHVQAVETPEEFEKKIILEQHKAQRKIDTHEATHVSITQSEEKESDYDKAKPKTFSAAAIFSETDIPIEINESHIMEKESLIKPFELPDTLKGKSVHTHMLPTVITQEVIAESHTSAFDKSKLETTKAELKQEVFNEFIVSEAQIVETLGDHTSDKKPSEKTAEISLRPVKSINVEETIPQIKEDQFSVKESPELSKATADIDSQQIATSTLVYSNEGIEKFVEEIPKSVLAQLETENLESIQILEHDVAEKEYDEVKMDATPTKMASIALNAQESLNITQILTVEREHDFLEEPQPTELKALPNVTPHGLTVQSEITETLSQVGDIITEDVEKKKAKRITKPLEELVVTETNLVEVEKKLLTDVTPSQKKATVDFTPEQELTITETIPSDKEQSLTEEKPESMVANVNIGGKQVALKEITDSEVYPGIYEQKHPDQQTASENIDLIYHVTEIQLTTGEKEGKSTQFEKPEWKKVNVDIIENTSVNISEEVTYTKEKDFDTPIPLNESTCGTTISSHALAVTSETRTQETVKDFISQISPENNAVSGHLPFDSVMSSETLVQEKEGIFEKESPNFKLAEMDFQLGHPISVTTIIHADREKKLDKEHVNKFHVDATILPQEVVTTKETIAHDSTSELLKRTPESASAIKSNIMLQSLVQEETIVGESEVLLKLQEKADEKRATVDVQEISAPLISEVISNERESAQDTQLQMNSKTATVGIESKPAANVEIVTSEDNIEEIIAEKPVTNTATIDQSTMEYLVSIQPIVHENEEVFIEKSNARKEAIVEVIENTGLIITEVSTQQKELPLTIDDHELRQAETNIIPKKTIIQSEMDINESYSPLEVQILETKSANPSLTTLNVGVVSEMIVNEFEKERKPDVLKKENAITSVDEKRHLIIESFAANDKESIFEDKPKELKLAQTDMESYTHVIASVYQSQTNESLSNLENKEGHSVQAIQSTLPMETLSQEIVTIIDSEKELLKDKSPATANASENICEFEGVQISQTTTNIKETDFIPNQLPKEKYATSSLDVTHKLAEKTTVETISSANMMKEHHPQLQRASTKEHSSEAIVVTENLGEETEVPFKGKFEPITSKAQVAPDEEKQALSISESLVQYKEDHLEEITSRKPEQAESKFIAQQAPEVSQIISEDTVSQLQNLKQKEEKASFIQDIQTGVTRLETQVGEKEGDFDDKIKFVTKSAQVKLEEGKALTSSEIFPVEIPKELDVESEPMLANVQMELSSHIPRETTETVATQNIEEINSQLTSSVNATFKNEPLQSLENFQILPLETPKEHIQDMAIVQKQAARKWDILSEVQINQVETQAPVKHIDEFENKEENAIKTVDTTCALQGSETIVNEILGEIRESARPTEKVNISHTVLQSYSQSFNTVHESEDTLDISAKDVKFAVPDIDQVQSVNIEHTLNYEKESEMKEFSSSDKQFADVSIPLREITVPKKSEIQLQETIEELKEMESTKKTVQPSQDELESLIVTERILQETGTSFESGTTLKKYPEISLQTGKHITTTEVVSSQTESGLYLEETEPKIAEKAVVPQVAMQIAQPDVKEAPSSLVIEETENVYPKVDQTTFENVVISETVTHEKEDKLFEGWKPETKSATVNLENNTKESLNILEITSHQTEIDLYEFSPPVKKAEVSVDEQAPLQQTETKSLDTVHELDKTSTEEKIAEVSQNSLQGIQITEQIVQEKEETFTEEKVTPKSAVPVIPHTDHISVSEVFINQNEKDLQKEDTMILKKADATVINQEAKQISETSVHQHVAELTTSDIQTMKANEEHIPFSNISISEVHPNEKEEQQLPDKIPQGQSANISIEHPQGSAVVSETITRELEVTFDTKTDTMKADLSLMHQDSLLLTEVKSYDTTDTLSESIPETVTASSNLDNQESVIITHSVANEKESELVISEKDLRSGTFSILPEEHLIVTEVKSSHKEDSLKLRKSLEQHAAKSIPTQEATEITEIRTEDFPTSLEMVKPNVSQIEQNYEPLKNISVTEVISSEKEESDQNITIMKSEKAHISVVMKEGSLNVSKIEAEEKEIDFATAKPSQNKASTKITEKTVSSCSETKPLDTLIPLKQQEPESTQISGKPILAEGLIETQANVHGTTLDMNESRIPKAEATLNIIEQSSITITEVNSQGQASDKIEKVIAKESTIHQKEIESLPVVLKEENVPLLSHETFSSDKIGSKKAHLTLNEEQYGLIITHQNTSENFENITHDEKQKTKKTPTISYGNQSSVIVTEIVPQETEGKLHSKYICHTVVSSTTNSLLIFI